MHIHVLDGGYRRRGHAEGLLIFKKAGFESVEDLRRTAVGFSSKEYQNLPPQPRMSTNSNGKQRVWIRVSNEQGSTTTQFFMQEYLNRINWKGIELSSIQRRCKASVEKFEHSPTAWAEWIEVKETLSMSQAARGKETSEQKGSNNVLSKAVERKRKSHALRPVEFCRRSLAGGNAWDSLTHLFKFMKLRQVGEHLKITLFSNNIYHPKSFLGASFRLRIHPFVWFVPLAQI